LQNGEIVAIQTQNHKMAENVDKLCKQAHRIVKMDVLGPDYDARIREIYIKANKEVGTSQTQIDRVLSTNLATPYKTFSTSTQQCLFAFFENEIADIVGIVTACKTDSTADIFELNNLAVDPDFQRRGIGTQLIQAAWMETRPFRLSAIASNTRSISFYKKCPWLELTKITKHHSVTDNLDYTLHHYRSVQDSPVETI